jgi:tRNA(fMet)-specific endonuclease VapC
VPRYLLDTNILSDLVREPRGTAATQLARVGEQRVCTSIIVSAELRYGAAKAGSPRLTERVELILSALDILPLEPPADQHYAEIRHHLARQGQPIGPNDLLIAAQARSQNLTLVTANTAEFTRVPALRVENWLDAGAVDQR